MKRTILTIIYSKSIEIIKKNKLVVLFAMLFLCFGNASAQTNLEDVVYLNNGSVIRGVIIEQIPGVSLKIKTKDGSIFVYEMKDVTKMTKEESYESKNSTQSYIAKEPRKEPGLAWLCSFLLPGGGQFYNGDIYKGIVYLVTPIAMTGLAAGITAAMGDGGNLGAYIAVGILNISFWIDSQIDAVRDAKEINKRNGWLAFNIGENSTLGISPDFQLYNQPMAFGSSKQTSTVGFKVNLSF